MLSTASHQYGLTGSEVCCKAVITQRFGEPDSSQGSDQNGLTDSIMGRMCVCVWAQSVIKDYAFQTEPIENVFFEKIREK